MDHLGRNAVKSESGIWMPSTTVATRTRISDDFAHGWQAASKTIGSFPRWIGVLVLVSFFAYRLSKVTHGDQSTMIAILESASLGDILVQMVLTAAPLIMVGLMPIVILPQAFLSKFWNHAASIAIVHGALLSIFLLTSSFVLSSSWFLTLLVVVLASVVLGWSVYWAVGPSGRLQKLLARHSKKYDQMRKSQKPAERARLYLIWSILTSIGAVAMLLSSSPVVSEPDYWGVPKNIVIAKGTFVGYVISSQSDDVTIMKESDRALVVLKDADIIMMEVCSFGHEYDRGYNIYSLGAAVDGERFGYRDCSRNTLTNPGPQHALQ